MIAQASPTQTDIAGAALRYAEDHGWNLLPLHHVTPDGSCSCGNRSADHENSRGKHPRVGTGWQHKASSDPEIIEQWFEQWPHANVGVKLGADSGIIDVEFDDDEGEQTLAELLDGDACFTPSYKSGRSVHRLFKHHSDIPGGGKKTVRGVEFRLGGNGSGAMSVLPPSQHHSGAAYEWLPGLSPDDVDIQPLPDALLALLLVATSEPDHDAQCIEKQLAEGREKQLALSALAGLKPERCEPYDCWLQVGMALHSVDPNDAELLEAWDDWSRQSPKHSAGDCHKKWHSFRSGGITLGTLIHLAKQDGWKPPAELVQRRSYASTDLGNADRFIDQHGDDILYCAKWKSWIVWDGQRWKEDDTLAIEQRAQETARNIYRECADIVDDGARNDLAKWAKASQARNRIEAMVSLSRSRVPASPDDFDTHDFLLCCPNGTVDLKTGRMREHRREDRIMKQCPTRYVHDAKAPRFEAFLRKILGGDEELFQFMIRFFGYCLTASMTEQCLTFFYGEGANGKSTLIETVSSVVGSDHFGSAAQTLILAGSEKRHSTELADIRGMRMLAVPEVEEGTRLGQVNAKLITGGDRVKARKMHKDNEEFKPTCKVVILANDLPVIRSGDSAMWRRVIVVPFNVRFWNPDNDETGPDDLRCNKDLPQVLARESEGILATLVRGCIEWQRDGLQIPKSARIATKQYREEMDILGMFIDECCTIGEDKRVKASAMLERLNDWLKGIRHERQYNHTSLGKEMVARGFQKQKSGSIYYLGLHC